MQVWQTTKLFVQHDIHALVRTFVLLNLNFVLYIGHNFMYFFVNHCILLEPNECLSVGTTVSVPYNLSAP